MATKTTKQDAAAADENVFETSTGLKITIKKVPPMFLQKVMNSVELPKRPTYETKTISGRTEIWPMDKDAAAQTEHGVARWEYYQEELERARNTQNERVMSAAFLLGTECDVPDDGWEKRQQFLGLDVPDDPDARRAHYLMTELPSEDIAELMSRIFRSIEGVPEELINDAEASFRRSVRS